MEDFRQASDRLSALGISIQEQAEALGLAYQTIRLMRLDSEAKGYRRPPPESNWRLTLGRLAQERAGELQRLAVELVG